MTVTSKNPVSSTAPLLWTWTPSLPEEAEGRADVCLSRALDRKQGAWTVEGKPCEAPAQNLSRSQIQKLIEAGKAHCDGSPLKSKSRIPPGSKIQLEVPPPRPLEVQAEDAPIELLYEDEHLAVLNKPQGLTVHPSSTQPDRTLVNRLLHHLKNLSGIGGVLRPGIVHRIDKDTSGALVVSKSDLSHQALLKIFAKHDIERRYWALCYGSPEDGKIESLIGRHPSDRKKMSMQVKQGRRAVTHVKVLEQFALPGKYPFASWVEVQLETGRTHQVRVHLTGQGASLLGDPVYGTPTERHTKWLSLPPEIRKLVEHLPGQALHARVLGFIHPVSGEKLRIEAPAPEIFAELLAALQKFGGRR